MTHVKDGAEEERAPDVVERGERLALMRPFRHGFVDFCRSSYRGPQIIVTIIFPIEQRETEARAEVMRRHKRRCPER